MSSVAASSSSVHGRGIGGRWHSAATAEVNARIRDLDNARQLYAGDYKNEDSDQEDLNERTLFNQNFLDAQRFGVQQPTNLTEDEIQNDPSVGLMGIGCANSFKISGEWLDGLEIHSYEVFFTEPAIPATEKVMRREVFCGGTYNERKVKGEFWRERIGRTWQFDGQLVWTTTPMSDTTLIVQRDEIRNGSKITLKYKGKCQLTQVPKQEAERMLNLMVVRTVMQVQKNKDGHPVWQSFESPKGTSWFDTINKRVETVNNNERRGEPALTVWFGRNVKITVSIDRKTGKKTFFLRVAESTRLQLTLNLQGQLKNMRNKNPNGYQREASYWVGRKAYLTYANQRGVVIGDFKWTMDETHEIDVAGKKMTLKQYYLQKYNVEIPEKQVCLVSQKGSPSSFFLPSLLVLSAKSDDAPLNYGDVNKYHSGKPHWDRFLNLAEFARTFQKFIAQSSLAGKLSVSDKPERIHLLQLANPTAYCKGKNGKKTPFDIGGCPATWVRTTGGPMDPLAPINSINIRFRPEHEREAQEVVKTYGVWCKQRNLNLPNPVMMEYSVVDQIAKEQTYRNQGAQPYDATLTILPEGVNGSMMKTLNSAMAYYARGVVSPAGRGPVLQHILARNCTRPNAVKGALGNLIQKAMNTMYTLETSCSNGLFQGIVWCLGISISHPGGVTKCSMAGLHLDCDPLVAGPKGWASIAIPLHGRKQVVSGRRMFIAMLELLKKASLDQPKAPLSQLLPNKLVIYRDGLADYQIGEALVEELQGIKKAIRKFAEENHIETKTEVNMVVVPKQGIDDCCPVDEAGNILKKEYDSAAMVIDQNVLSVAHTELLIIVNRKAKNAKPRRLIIAHDTSGATLTAAALRDNAEFYLACCWAYAYALPFSTGVPSLPLQIKLASKYAEMLLQCITTKDKDLDRFHVCSASWRPTIVKE